MLIIHFWTPHPRNVASHHYHRTSIYSIKMILQSKSDSVMNMSHNNLCKQRGVCAEMNIPRRNLYSLFE